MYIGNYVICFKNRDESNWEFLCYKDKRKGWISYFYLCGYFYDDEMVIWKVGLRLMFGNV